MDSEREAQAIVIFEAESRKIATTPVDGWRALGCLFAGEGEPPISECCQQGVQLCSLHATVDEESGWGAKQGSRPYMEARPISDVGRPGRSLVHRGELLGNGCLLTGSFMLSVNACLGIPQC